MLIESDIILAYIKEEDWLKNESIVIECSCILVERLYIN